MIKIDVKHQWTTEELRDLMNTIKEITNTDIHIEVNPEDVILLDN